MAAAGGGGTGESGSAEDGAGRSVPDGYGLSQNYPNPFNPLTRFAYAIPTGGHVSLRVLNMLGQTVATIVHKEQEAGYQSVDFDAADLPSGLYVYRLQVGSFIDVKKMVVLK